MANGAPITLPLPADATAWLQSLERVAENFLHAACLPAAGLPDHRAWTLPALNPRMDALVQAIGRQTAPEHAREVTCSAAAAGVTGAGLPEQHLPLTEALGFQHDGTLDLLVRRARADAGNDVQ